MGKNQTANANGITSRIKYGCRQASQRPVALQFIPEYKQNSKTPQIRQCNLFHELSILFQMHSKGIRAAGMATCSKLTHKQITTKRQTYPPPIRTPC